MADVPVVSSRVRDLAVVGLLATFFLSLPLAGFLGSLGFLGLAAGSLTVALVIANSE